MQWQNNGDKGGIMENEWTKKIDRLERENKELRGMLENAYRTIMIGVKAHGKIAETVEKIRKRIGEGE